MNRRAVRYIAWKEWRVQRAFVLAMLGMGLVAHWVLPNLLRLAASEVPAFVFSIALTTTAFYALGCGAMLFALERERGTHAFQRALPIPSRELAVGKVVFAFASALILGVILLSSAIVRTGGEWPLSFMILGRESLGGMEGGTFLVLEALVWGLFFSIQGTLVMTSLLLACMMIFLTVCMAAPALGSGLAIDVQLMARSGFLACGAMGALFLVRRGGCDQSMDATVEPLQRNDRDGRTRRGWLERRAQWSSFRRLVWQQWRSSSAVFLPAMGLFFMGLIYFVVVDFLSVHEVVSVSDVLDLWSSILFHLLVVLPIATLGALTFNRDQGRFSRRFLAERGIHPGQIWMSRLILSGTIAMGWLVVIMVISYLDLGHWPSIRSKVLGPIALLSLTTFSAGQFCSQLIRSGILAVTMGLVVAWGLCSWASLMNFSQVPISWSVLPIPLLLLWGTYRRMPEWLLGNRSWKESARTAAWVVVPALILVTTLAVFRAYQLPPVSPRALEHKPSADIMSSEALETGALYAQALNIIDEAFPEDRLPMQTEAQRRAVQAAIRLVEDAGSRPTCTFRPGLYTGRTPTAGKTPHLSMLILNEAARARQEQDLDLALRRCLSLLTWSVHLAQPQQGWTARFHGLEHHNDSLEELCRWASHPDQTIERLDRATREVEQILDRMSPPSQTTDHEYRWLMQALADTRDSSLTPINHRHAENPLTDFAFRFVPWEVERFRRTVAREWKKELQFWHLLEQQVAASPTGTRDQGFFVRPKSWHGPYGPRPSPDILQGWFLKPDAFPLGRFYFGGDNRSELQAVTHRRAWRLAMAIHRWRIEHGRWPKSLEELGSAAGHPVDAYSGHPLFYAPHWITGLPKNRHGMSLTRREKRIPVLNCYFRDIDLVDESVWAPPVLNP